MFIVFIGDLALIIADIIGKVYGLIRPGTWHRLLVPNSTSFYICIITFKIVYQYSYIAYLLV